MVSIEWLLGHLKQPMAHTHHWCLSDQYTLNCIETFASCSFVVETHCSGSILAGLDTFKRMWVARKEYDDEGARAIERKTF